ncbi:MAG: phosphatase PAP2 family protein [Bacteroidales bacterium]|nr:phosphatase PAP2 family protein [Bacteroidales bacterium]
MSGLLSSLEHWDKVATLWINHFHSPASDAIWLFFSSKTVWIPFYLLLIYIMIRKLGWKKALAAIVAIVLAVAACDQLANLVKDAACRLRPNKDHWMIERGLHILQKGGLYGFFSAHAATCFSVASCSSSIVRGQLGGRLERVWAPVLYCWAALISLSRIFVAKHYLGDVLAGAAVGVIVGLFLAGSLKAIMKATAMTRE